MKYDSSKIKARTDAVQQWHNFVGNAENANEILAAYYVVNFYVAIIPFRLSTQRARIFAALRGFPQCAAVCLTRHLHVRALFGRLS